MPKGALLINTARKEVIYEEDLARILEERTDFHYVADVAPTIADTLKEKSATEYSSLRKKWEPKPPKRTSMQVSLPPDNRSDT